MSYIMIEGGKGSLPCVLGALFLCLLAFPALFLSL